MQTLNSTKRPVLRPLALIAALTLSLATVSRADVLYSVTVSAINALNPNNGALLNSFVPPVAPQAAGGDGLAFSGTALYYTTISTSQIYVLNPSTGTILNNYPAPVTGIDALGYGTSTFGSTLFALDYTANRLYWLNPVTGGTFQSTILGFDAVGGIDFDTARGTLYVTDLNGVIRELNPNTGLVLNSFSTGAFQTGLGFVGGRLFTSAQTASTIEERDPVSGTILNSFVSPGGSAGALAGSPVPEPSAIALFGAALVAMIPSLRRRIIQGTSR